MLRKVYDHKTARFLQFIRHILGLEELASGSETITRAFDEFIAAHNTLSALQIRFLQIRFLQIRFLQIRFLQTLRTFILQNGRVERRDLIDAPFTRIHPKGIRGVFTPAEVEEVVGFATRLVA